VAQIGDVEAIIVNNETESLILENNLIKRYRPRFNSMLKQKNSGYSYIVLTAEAIPRLIPYRKHRANKDLEGAAETRIARRFGPYISRRFRDTLLDFVNENFQLRTCHPLPSRACLRYHIHKCSGICEQQVTAAQYSDDVKQAMTFLSSRHTGVIGDMKRRMRQCAGRLEFEKAQRIKEQVEILERALEKQIVERDVSHDQDVIYFGDGKALVAQIQRGALQELHLFDLGKSANAEACQQFLFGRYAQRSPKELILNRLNNPEQVAVALTTVNRYKVKVTLPKRGVACRLLQLCELNYDYRVANE
jgi:excinuclease ABC subunit C